MDALRASRFALLALVTFGSVSCGALGGGSTEDRLSVRAAVEPALACDNAERCARGMELDLVADARLSAADRAAVADTIRSLRELASAEVPSRDARVSVCFAERLNRAVDAALAQWQALDARYGRRRVE